MELIIGKPDVRPSTPSHSVGVREGNRRHRWAREPGIQPEPTPRRSTGVNARGRTPIDPRMPRLTPP